MKSVLKVKSKNTQVTQEKIEPKYVEDKATEQYLDYISESGNVMRHNGDKYVNTGINLKGPRGAVGPRGLPGKDGITPHIGENGNWYIGEQDTGSKAELNTDEYVTKEELDETIGEASEILDSLEGYSGIGEKLNELETNLETKANKDGFYETLGAGTALNLQGNTSKDATFTYRTAGGSEDIASGLATIHSIKGNTVVWNQIFDNSKLYSAIVPTQFAASQTEEGNLRLIAKNGLNITYRYCTWNKTKFTPTLNHIVYVSVNVTEVIHPEPNHIGGIWCKCGHNGSTTTLLKQGAIKEFDKPLTKGLYRSIQTVENTSSGNWLLQLGCTIYNSAGNAVDTSTGGWGFEVKSINIIDLTLMFGAGNEPSTVEEFEEWLTNNVGLKDYYEYSEPTMLSADANSLETVGFNQWDGTYSQDNRWYNASTDTVESDTNYAISNFISVFPNTEYFIKGTRGANVGMVFYDKDKVNLKQSIAYNNRTSFTFTTPTNAAYLKFTIRKANKNITNLNLSWSGIRNGEYEKYWKRTYPINVKQLTSNGDVIFPNGMNRVGNVYDEIVSVDGVTKAIKRIGSVDLGSLTWEKRTSKDGCVLFRTISTVVRSNAVRVDSNYNTTDKFIINKSYKWYGAVHPNTNLAEHDKSISFNSNYDSVGAISVYDSAYTDTTAFKNAMNGVVVYFQLVTPIEYEIDNFEMPLAYKVDDFGTEETKKDTFSLSPTFAVTYGINAVDTLRRLPTNYISKESMQNFLSALGVQMNGTWTMTLDNNEYKFSFVANSNENE